MAGNKHRVLIVEDETNVSRLFQITLQDVFDVETAGTVAVALTRLSHEPPVAAVVLDLMLPNGQGVAVVRRFQDAHPDTPIVVVTGFDFSEAEVIESGAQEFLPKRDASQAALVHAVSKAVVRHGVRSVFEPIEQKLAELKGETVQRLEQTRQTLSTPSCQMGYPKPPSWRKDNSPQPP